MKRAKAKAGEIIPRLQQDGRWRTKVTIGTDPLTGKPRRRDVYGATSEECALKARKLLDRVTHHGMNSVPRGRDLTVSQWIDQWLLASRETQVLRPNTLSGYESMCRIHIVPMIGNIPLNKLSTQDVHLMLTATDSEGNPAMSAAMRRHAHKVLSAALAEAERYGHVDTNVAKLVRTKRPREPEVVPLSVGQVRQVLSLARSRDEAARWQLALVLGLRQSEALGLRWQDIDLDKGLMHVSRQLNRRRWQHGCDVEHDCPGTPSTCPQARRLDELAETKTDRSVRTITLPEGVVADLRRQRKVQDRQRRRAKDRWVEKDFVFTGRYGNPVSQRVDQLAWRDLLVDAGVPHIRLHDARHTAATLLVALGTPHVTIMEVMGWSHLGMITRYTHRVDDMHRRAADGMQRLLEGEISRSL
ncbi:MULTISPECIES: tyrosine-type recombinase/integrase [unclassified Luteococcus]|uniref:tyrosine-type recombinase/integrase n=1 Tax=unclassified Luteococcus TaxID=2639923 RepID=UPI00313BF9EF